VKVALPHPEPEAPPTAPLRAPAELLPASHWWVENVILPSRRGFAIVKDRDGCRCQNPECGRIALRNEAHPIHERHAGGSDELANGVTLCRVCHLRGVHGGRLTVRAIELEGRAVLHWTWLDGRQVFAFRERPAVVDLTP